MKHRKFKHQLLAFGGICLGILTTNTKAKAQSLVHFHNSRPTVTRTEKQPLHQNQIRLTPARQPWLYRNYRSYPDHQIYPRRTRRVRPVNRLRLKRQGNLDQKINRQTNRLYHRIIQRRIRPRRSQIRTPKPKRIRTQRRSRFVRRNNRLSRRNTTNWYRDGLGRNNLRARNWIVGHESGHHWYILSYGGVCVGYFQMNPAYLGYRHGRIDLRPQHQVKVADRYVKRRYGNWINAKRFWVSHHWY